MPFAAFIFILDLLNLLGYVSDMKLRNYLHGISFDEYQKSCDTTNVTEEMWSKAERHLIKLLETRPMQKEVRMTDNLLAVVLKITAPILLMNGRYDPACTKHQIDYILSHAQNVTQAVFENSGHFPRIEEAKEYTNTLLDFLEI